ncbi:hypothetical protein BH24ACT3_BH24ACT3_02040 [soil metagenome]
MVLTALVAVTAWRLSGAVTGPGARTIERALVALVVGLAEVCLVLQVLGMLGLLSRVPTVVAVLVIAVATTLFADPVPPAPREVRSPGLGPVLAGASASALLALALVTGLNGRSMGYDTVQYHAPFVGTWLRTHQLWDLPPVNPGYLSNSYPSNFELSALWLALPSGSDELVYAVNGVWGLLAVLAVAVSTRCLGGRVWCGVLVSTAVMWSPILYFTHAHSLATDVAAGAGIAAAVAMLLCAREADRAAPWLAVAGLALGLAVGTKYTAVLPGVGVVVLAGVLARRGTRTRSLAVTVASALVVSGFWYLRNAVATGNPLFPQEVAAGGLQLWDGATTPLDRFSTSMADHLIHWRNGPLRTWVDFVGTEYGPVVVVFALGTVGAVSLRRPVAARTWIGGLAFACGLAYLVTPYTGGGEDGTEFLIASQLRYAAPMALVAAAVAASGRRPVVLVASTAAVIATVYGVVHALDGPGFRDDLGLSAPWWVGVLVVAPALGLSIWWFWPAPGPAGASRPAPVVLAGLVLALGVAVIGLQVNRRPEPDTVERVLAGMGRPEGPVSFVSVRDVRSLMGRSFEIQLVGVSPDASNDAWLLADGDRLDARLAELRPALVAVGSAPSPTKPPGWEGPAGWQIVHREAGAAWFAPPTEQVPGGPTGSGAGR